MINGGRAPCGYDEPVSLRRTQVGTEVNFTIGISLSHSSVSQPMQGRTALPSASSWPTNQRLTVKTAGRTTVGLSANKLTTGSTERDVRRRYAGSFLFSSTCRVLLLFTGSQVYEVAMDTHDASTPGPNNSGEILAYTMHIDLAGSRAAPESEAADT